jgi:sporulation protein YlmC with PRC-barrel domain
MKKILLATSILAVLGSTAWAQEATQPAPVTPAGQAPATTETAPTPSTPAKRGAGHLASNVIGEEVYNSAADNAEEIGEVKDIVIGNDGMVTSLVVGVGGFLGIGDRDVAVDFKQVTWAEKDGNRWLVMPTTKEQLEAMAPFDPAPYAMTPPAAASAPATPAAPADPAAPATPPTAAPAPQ